MTRDYDPRFPAKAGAPALVATAQDYQALKRQLGIARHVIVQPSAYGTDNRCLLDALAYFGDDARGIAVIAEHCSEEELTTFHAAGVRGIRFNLKKDSDTSPLSISNLDRRVADLGWHMQFNATSRQLVGLAPLLGKLASPIVIDHLGHPDPLQGLNDPVIKMQLSLLDAGNTWVKLSGAYIDSKVGGPRYEDMTPFVRALVAARPDRLVWGSDWPHPTAGHTLPDDINLLSLMAEWVPDAQTRDAIMTSNSARLYGF
jgi:D-galactarolactone isomerase